MGNPDHKGLNGDRLRHLKSVMEADITRGRYFGGVLSWRAMARWA
jgi:hypothetical protein